MMSPWYACPGPHPPHILRDFMPMLSKFGDVAVDDEALFVLVDHICTLVERNQVQWTNKHAQPLKYDRHLVLTVRALLAE